MFQRSITSKMRVKWVLNPKALTTNFPHAAHPVGVLLLAYSISPLFTCIPYLSKLQVINVIAINRQSRRERNCLHVCLLRCPSVQPETRWCLNCPIYTSLWLIRQVLLAWTLPLYTDQHPSHREQSCCHTNRFFLKYIYLSGKKEQIILYILTLFEWCSLLLRYTVQVLNKWV